MKIDFTCEELYAIEQTLSTKNVINDSHKSALAKIQNIKVQIGSIFNIKNQSGDEWEAMFCQTDSKKAQFICLIDGNRIFDVIVELTDGKATIKEIFDSHNGRIMDMYYLGEYGDTHN